jgi:hypothetical protein
MTEIKERRMITIQSKIQVDGISGAEIFNFLINPTDHAYQNWWPGIHLQFHPLRRTQNHLGDKVYMDEWIGKYRVKMAAVVMEAEPGRKIVWQAQKWIRLPAWIRLELADSATGVTLVHTICIGFRGMGRIFDPFLRIYFSSEFEEAMDEHARIEFPRLRDMLSFAKPVV